jgi:heme oxygenase
MTIAVPTLEREPSSRRATNTDILTRLKLETAAEHAAIEAAAGVMNPELRVEQYADYLAQSFGFYAPVEAMLERLGAWQALGLSRAERSKLPLLEHDLLALGRDPSALPRCEAPPRLRDAAEAFGCLYVLEGSTLGGRVISRHVQARLGAELPRRFLDGYGAETGERWQEFRRALAAAARGRDHQGRDIDGRIIAGAKSTFETFTAWLRRSATAG